jgi:hypothetical protein
LCRVSDDGPIFDNATSTGAVVRKPPKKEIAVGGAVAVRRALWRFGVGKWFCERVIFRRRRV